MNQLKLDPARVELAITDCKSVVLPLALRARYFEIGGRFRSPDAGFLPEAQLLHRALSKNTRYSLFLLHRSFLLLDVSQSGRCGEIRTLKDSQF